MRKLFTILILLLVVTACSDYNKIVKGDDYSAKFEEANRLFQNEKYDRCVVLYEQVYQRSPKSPQGEVSYFRLGIACYKVKDWYLASYYLGSFQSKFPYSNNVEEATFLAALCAVNNSPEPSLDQNETNLALVDLQNFVNRFPNSDYVDTCNLIMNKLRFKLQTKEVMSVRLYQKTENYRSAVVSAETFLQNYPVSEYREEVWGILVRNSFELTVNSVESKKKERIEKTIERYNNFVAEFPESSYLREFERYESRLNAMRSEIKEQ